MTDLRITVLAGLIGGLAAVFLGRLLRSAAPQVVDPDRVTGVRILGFSWWYRATTLFMLAITIATVVDIDSVPEFRGTDLVIANIITTLMGVRMGPQRLHARTPHGAIL